MNRYIDGEEQGDRTGIGNPCFHSGTKAQARACPAANPKPSILGPWPIISSEEVSLAFRGEEGGGARTEQRVLEKRALLTFLRITNSLILIINVRQQA